MATRRLRVRDGLRRGSGCGAVDGAVGRRHRRGAEHARGQRHRLRHVRHVRDDHDLCGVAAPCAGPQRLPAAGGSRRAGGVRADARRRHRGRRHGRRQRPHRAVRRAGDTVVGVLRPGRQLPPQDRQLGERDQVLRPRRVLVCVLPLRHRPRLRRRRVDEHHRHRGHAERHDPGGAQRCARPRRHRAAACRPRVQGGGRAVPRVDTRRVSGRADARHRADGLHRQGRRVRRPRCACSSSRCPSIATTGGP